jgi:hypothetical protein
VAITSPPRAYVCNICTDIWKHRTFEVGDVGGRRWGREKLEADSGHRRWIVGRDHDGAQRRTLYDMAIKRTSRVLTVSLPPDAAEDFERIAEEEGRNRSELFREMLRVYQTYLESRTFESLQRYGAAQASRTGITSEEDVERLIQEARG